MSSPHLPGPHGFIIAAKMSLFLLLFCLGAQFFPTTQERNQSISIQSPVQLLNNSLPLFNNLFVNQTNSFQIEPNSYQVKSNSSFQLILYREPDSFQMILYREPDSFQMILYFEPNSYKVIPEPNSYQVFQNNYSVQVSYETPSLKNTLEQTVLYLLLRLQENYVDSENNTRENETIQNNIERNIILTQINSFFIYSI